MGGRRMVNDLDIRWFVLLMMANLAIALAIDNGQMDEDFLMELTKGQEERDILEALEALARKKAAQCRLDPHPDCFFDTSATEYGVKTSEVNGETYNENEEGSQRNRFDDNGRPQLHTNLIEQKRRQIGRSHFDDFSSPRLESESELSPEGKEQLKRRHFDDLRHSESYRRLSDSGSGQMERNLFDNFKRQRSNGELNDVGEGQFRRSNDYFEIQRNRDNYGDMGTPQSEGRQKDKINSPIPRRYSDDFEREQIQNRQYVNGKADTHKSQHYYSEEQQTPKKYIAGQKSRQMGDNRFQNLQPELQIRDIYYDDYGNPQEEIRQHYSKANDRKKPKTAEAEEMSSDELLALLTKLVREKRQ